MILGIGTDAVNISRFAHWYTFTHKQLRRIFSADEITYCLAIPHLSAERFAVRFAIREAFYKAIAPKSDKKLVPFLIICRAIMLQKNDNQQPYLIVNWDILTPYFSLETSQLTMHVSLTHTHNLAIAFIVIEKK